jgi:acetyl esterase/lipase
MILALEGGGWKKTGWEQYGQIIASALGPAGFIVATAEYTFSTPGRASWPANLLDVRDAVRWLRSHADRIGGDPNRIVALGESAGGQLASLLATFPSGSPDGSQRPSPADPSSSVSAQVQALVDFYGPTDLTALHQESPRAGQFVVSYLGGTPEEVPTHYIDASPITHVASGDPPTLIFQGGADTGVPPDQSQRFADALTAAGVPNQLVFLPGIGHGFKFQIGRMSLVPFTVAFLDNALGLNSGTATSPTG